MYSIHDCSVQTIEKRGSITVNPLVSEFVCVSLNAFTSVFALFYLNIRFVLRLLSNLYTVQYSIQSQTIKTLILMVNLNNMEEKMRIPALKTLSYTEHRRKNIFRLFGSNPVQCLFNVTYITQANPCIYTQILFRGLNEFISMFAGDNARIHK